MKKIAFMLGLGLIMVVQAVRAETSLGGGSVVRFATVVQAKEILTRPDDFVRSMSPFDRSARLKTDRAVLEKEYLEFVGKNILEWDAEEQQKVSVALQEVQAKLAVWALPFPPEVLLVKTTGAEEGRAAYTRANVIILPANEIAAPAAKLGKTICHELFHVLSRANPKLKEKLYAVIGFVSCDEVLFPAFLRARKITNPDAPANNHCLRVKIAGADQWVIPILYAGAEKYDVARGGEFFDYLKFEFLVVTKKDQAPVVEPVYDGRQPRLVEPARLSGFFEQVGRNTGYIIHPEEILADNFALLILEGTTVPSPDILKKMTAVLTGK